MVELILNGKPIELLRKGQQIKYNRQIADIFDIASVSSSYTNSFTIPKTPNNTEVFEQLSIVGDQSTIPYTKIPVTVRNNGFDLITNGWLNVQSTAEDYKCSIIDGMVDFFKMIENKTIGVDLDLSNFEHTKSMESIVDSFDNEYYNYIVADFGASNYIINFFPFQHAINIDYLVPSFSVKKILELIFSTFGYTYESIEMDSFIDGLFITYPTPPLFDTLDEDIIGSFVKDFWTSTEIVNSGDKFYVVSENNWDNYTVEKGEVVNNLNYILENTSNYNMKFSIEAYARYYSPFIGSQYKPCRFQIIKNNQVIYEISTNPFEAVDVDFNFFAQSGDSLSWQLFVNENSYIVNRFGTDRTLTLRNFSCNKITMQVYEISSDDVILSDAFKSFKIKDFFKELLYRTGLTPFADNIEKKITFISISQRIDTSNAIDWSDKYVRRKNEIYLKNSYAQRNIFKMKYNEGMENENDGILNVNNKNIDEEKILATSLIYSPIEGFTSFRPTNGDRVSTPVLPMFTKEVNTEEDGSLKIDYKKLDNRFYFIRRNTVTDRQWVFKSQIVPDEETVNQIHFATTERTLLGQLIAENFTDYEMIFDNFRAHEIELALGLEDILNLDLTRPYYFKQEAGYYILNKLPYQDGETTTGEFVRINKQ